MLPVLFCQAWTFHTGKFREAAAKILKSKNVEAAKVINEAIDYLLKLGFEELRTLGDEPENPS